MANDRCELMQPRRRMQHNLWLKIKKSNAEVINWLARASKEVPKRGPMLELPIRGILYVSGSAKGRLSFIGCHM